VSDLLVVADEVREALAQSRPVVALETTLVAHGFPPAQGAEVGRAAEECVRKRGAVPATVGVLDGCVRVGLSADELARFSAAGGDARKVGPRDLAAAAVQGATGATTVGGTLAVCRFAGIRFLATGGVGGVHRGWRELPDVSPDLGELARARALVVSSGVKSLLDVSATAEVLESLAVPTLGYRTDELPLFYSARGGPAVATRVETPAEAARIAAAHWHLGGAAVLLARPPDPELTDVEPLIERVVEEVQRLGVTGQAVTPLILSRLNEASGGRTLEINRRLVVDNAALAADVAVAYGDAQPAAEWAP
jgi:pseudouridine-5'-phosphate glycosidase